MAVLFPSWYKVSHPSAYIGIPLGETHILVRGLRRVLMMIDDIPFTAKCSSCVAELGCFDFASRHIHYISSYCKFYDYEFDRLFVMPCNKFHM